jgi:hypothetical protein
VDHRDGRGRRRLKDIPAVALQDLLAHVPARWAPVRRPEHAESEIPAWPHVGSDARASDGERRRERSLWCHPGEAASGDRPPPPSGRMAASHMPRPVFLAFAFGWGAIVVILLGVVVAIRWLG